MTRDKAGEPCTLEAQQPLAKRPGFPMRAMRKGSKVINKGSWPDVCFRDFSLIKAQKRLKAGSARRTELVFCFVLFFRLDNLQIFPKNHKKENKR